MKQLRYNNKKIEKGFTFFSFLYFSEHPVCHVAVGGNVFHRSETISAPLKFSENQRRLSAVLSLKS
jgi:hypothetical protein